MMDRVKNWTQGPWRILTVGQDCRMVAGKIGYTDIKNNDPVVIAETNNWLPENLPNRSLIAAAPDLVEALEELVDLMQGVIDGDYKPDSFTLKPAKAALDKVYGETN